jgi:hypothetical protein
MNTRIPPAATPTIAMALPMSSKPSFQTAYQIRKPSTAPINTAITQNSKNVQDRIVIGVPEGFMV